MYTISRRGFLAALGTSLIAMQGRAADTSPALLQRPVPRSGELLPAIGLGTWQAFDFDADAAAQPEALDTLSLLAARGARVIDTSPMYGRAEAVLGQLLAQADPQHRSFIATKVWTRGRKEGLAQIEDSFRLLGRDTLDLVQIHNLLDYEAHLPTLQALKREGRIRHIGATHYTAGAHAQLVRAMTGGVLDFVQVNYSLLEREAAASVLPAAAANGVAVLVNRPFAEGELFRRTRGKPLPEWAGEFGAASWAQFALKFILGQPAVTCAIPGTRNPKYLADNLGAALGPVPDAATCKRMAAWFDAL
jgi:aryl-alcohol dehydrogenase-like predicted oxidoreductase